METMNLDLINALTKVLTNHIDSQIQKRVSELMTTDEAGIREIVKEEINEHCGNDDHKDESDIEDIVGNKLDDHDFTYDIESALANYDFSDAIKKVLSNVTVNLTLD